MPRLEGKTAIVTGASRGIGAEISRLFAAEGANVICAARTVNEGDHPLEGSLARTIADIKDAGGEATPIAVNISLPEDCERLVAEAQRIYGPVDVLVNNAALTYYLPIRDFPLNRWLRSWAVNFHAPFILSQLVLPEMMERRAGSIVNISSGSAVGPGRGPYTTPGNNGTCYGAEKAALERFTQGLAQEVYEYNIAVSAVAPSLVVPTPGTVYHHLVEGMDDPRGEPPELLAQATLLLASEPTDKVAGRVCYSQQILLEFGWISEGRGWGVDDTRGPGSGYSQM